MLQPDIPQEIYYAHQGSSYIAIGFLAALIATIMVEVIISLLFGFRQRKALLVIVLVNLITNPALNAILLAINTYLQDQIAYIALPLLEMVVILIEGFLISHALNMKGAKPYVLSAVMNIASYGTYMIYMVFAFGVR